MTLYPDFGVRVSEDALVQLVLKGSPQESPPMLGAPIPNGPSQPSPYYGRLWIRMHRDMVGIPLKQKDTNSAISDSQHRHILCWAESPSIPPRTPPNLSTTTLFWADPTHPPAKTSPPQTPALHTAPSIDHTASQALYRVRVEAIPMLMDHAELERQVLAFFAKLQYERLGTNGSTPFSFFSSFFLSLSLPIYIYIYIRPFLRSLFLLAVFFWWCSFFF